MLKMTFTKDYLMSIMGRIEYRGTWKAFAKEAKHISKAINVGDNALIDLKDIALFEEFVALLLKTGSTLDRKKYILMGFGLGVFVTIVLQKKEKKNDNRVCPPKDNKKNN
jgi:hypothetical protein